MKRICLLMVLVLSTMLMMAEGHMTFKGVEIDGSLNSFVQKMKDKGFTLVAQEGENAVMSGTFTNENVYIFIYASPHSSKVYQVGVLYEGGSQWSMVETRYTTLKNSLIQKYGEPSECKEYVESPYESAKLFALRMEKLLYLSTFNTERGTILLKIAYEPNTVGNAVILIYVDNINSIIQKSEVIDEL